MLHKSKISDVLSGLKNPAEFASDICLDPHFIQTFNPVLGHFEYRFVACGHCVKCQDKSRNEWVSRMCLHSLAYEHCYYITLTYGSYDLRTFDNHPFLEDWLKSYPVRDRMNYKRRFVCSPSILVQEHLTKFIKRLRVNTGADLSYCACGEYGSKYNEDPNSTINGKSQKGYGRPHFHVIIWSHQLIKYTDFRDAWSYFCVEIAPNYWVSDNGKYDIIYKRHRFLIGHVDFHDLVANGSLNWNSEVEDNNNLASRAFNYVAKYIKKQDEFPEAALIRFNRTFRQLPIPDSSWNIEPENITNELLEDSIDNYRTFTRNGITYEKINFTQFKSLNAPFFVCSRKKAIGKEYFLQRVEDFKKGNFALPQFNGKNLEFPTYFHRLTNLALYPLRLLSVSEKSISLVKNNLPYLRSHYCELLQFNDISDFLAVAVQDSTVFNSVLNVPIRGSKCKFGSVKDGDLTYGNIYDIVLSSPCEGVNVRYSFDIMRDQFVGKVYDRKSKDYVYYNSFPRIEFLSMLVDLIDKEIDRYNINQLDLWRELENEVIHRIQSDPRTPELREKYLLVREENQRKYYCQHYLISDHQ